MDYLRFWTLKMFGFSWNQGLEKSKALIFWGKTNFWGKGHTRSSWSYFSIWLLWEITRLPLVKTKIATIPRALVNVNVLTKLPPSYFCANKSLIIVWRSITGKTVGHTCLLQEEANRRGWGTSKRRRRRSWRQADCGRGGNQKTGSRFF